MAKLPASTRVLFAKRCNVNDQDESGFQRAVQAAKGADIGVVVVCEQARWEGQENLPAPTDGEWYDVANLDLTGVQEDLIKAIQATGTPIALVLVNGRPLSTQWEAEHVPAIVEAWEPGEQRAAAIADVLIGDYNPSGRLSISIPRGWDSYPLTTALHLRRYWVKGAWTHTQGYVDMPGTPLYPFGYGTSYTQFQYSNLEIEPAEIFHQGTFQVRVGVENTGKTRGIETVQL